MSLLSHPYHVPYHIPFHTSCPAYYLVPIHVPFTSLVPPPFTFQFPSSITSPITSPAAHVAHGVASAILGGNRHGHSMGDVAGRRGSDRSPSPCRVLMSPIGGRGAGHDLLAAAGFKSADGEGEVRPNRDRSRAAVLCRRQHRPSRCARARRRVSPTAPAGHASRLFSLGEHTPSRPRHSPAQP